MKIKPIFVVWVPKRREKEFFKHGLPDMQKNIKGYNIITTGTFGDEFKFECFNAYNIDPIDIEELKRKLTNEPR